MHAVELDSHGAYANISLVSQQYEGNGVTVILEWTQERPLYSYHVNITPQLALMFNESTRVRLTARYNILYNFSVAAAHLCGQHNVTSSTELYYSEYHTSLLFCLYHFVSYYCKASVDCGNPAVLIVDGMLSVVGYSNPARLGSSVSLSCPPGFLLIGPNRTTCMGNGEWEPSIGKVRCEGEKLPVSNFKLNNIIMKLFHMSIKFLIAIISQR